MVGALVSVSGDLVLCAPLNLNACRFEELVPKFSFQFH